MRAANVYCVLIFGGKYRVGILKVGTFHSKAISVIILIICMSISTSVLALPTGINGDQSSAGGPSDVSRDGCSCHGAEQTTSVVVIMGDMPLRYQPGESYDISIELVGGPDINSASNTGGFALKFSKGTLTGASGYENLVQNWEDDNALLTHTSAGATVDDRIWVFTWVAPEVGSGPVDYWIAANSVNGADGPAGDQWNKGTSFIPEGEVDADPAPKVDVWVSNGEVQPKEAHSEGHDLHEMGAPFRAHWLGILGFGAVIVVIIFCGVMLRYGFSQSYTGRSNLLRLRYHHNRRGDQ